MHQRKLGTIHSITSLERVAHTEHTHTERNTQTCKSAVASRAKYSCCVDQPSSGVTREESMIGSASEADADTLDGATQTRARATARRRQQSPPAFFVATLFMAVCAWVFKSRCWCDVFCCVLSVTGMS